MKIKFIALSLCLIASANVVKGQDNGKKFTPSTNKHEIRISASDNLTLSLADAFSRGLSDALTGSKESDEKGTLGYGIGYRYTINRFRVGGDLVFSQTSSKLTLAGESSPSVKQKDLNFLILPTAEFIYYKRNLVELYGSAAVGANLVRHTEKGLTEAGKAAAGKADFSPSFAYQVNPIAIRVGNDRIGGFLEGGLGHKGILTAGISLRF